jgi:hypothetical protein
MLWRLWFLGILTEVTFWTKFKSCLDVFKGFWCQHTLQLMSLPTDNGHSFVVSDSADEFVNMIFVVRFLLMSFSTINMHHSVMYLIMAQHKHKVYSQLTGHKNTHAMIDGNVLFVHLAWQK